MAIRTAGWALCLVTFLLLHTDAVAQGKAASARAAGESFRFLRYNQLSCPVKNSDVLERIVDAPDRASFATGVAEAIYRGKCIGGRTPPIEVTQVTSKKTPSGREYVCFHRVDALTREDTGEFCSSASAISTVQAEIQARTGDYRITKEEAPGIKADCLEGGSIMILKDPAGWMRMSFILPKELNPPERSIAKNREAALREGCKGVDYKE